jgi:hypothetical protein
MVNRQVEKYWGGLNIAERSRIIKSGTPQTGSWLNPKVEANWRELPIAEKERRIRKHMRGG